MADVNVEITNEKVRKYSLTSQGYDRVSREKQNLEALSESPHVPDLISAIDNGKSISLQLQYIDGQNAKQWLNFNEDWTANKLSWKSAKKRLGQYALAEMDLLSRGAMYRDLNLEHLIFTDETAMLIDHEATIFRSTDDDLWQLNDHRGTWETMAPEEFPGQAELTSRTATYRVAVIAHLALAGHLPFGRFSSRSQTYAQRNAQPARVSYDLPMPIRRIFAAALARKPVHRYKDPARFFEVLSSHYDLSGKN